MLIFTPNEIDILILDNVREKKKDIIHLIKNSITEYYDKKKFTYYTTKDKIVCITFDESIPQLDNDKDMIVPIYNLCRLLLKEEPNIYSIFCFQEYGISVTFKDDILLKYETNIKDLEIYIRDKKKGLVANSNSSIYIYSDKKLVATEIEDIIDFNSKDVYSKLENSDILLKKSPMNKILNKVNIKFSLTDFLVKSLGFITLLSMLGYFISQNNELNKNIKEMNSMKNEMKKMSMMSSKIEEINTNISLIKNVTNKSLDELTKEVRNLNFELIKLKTSSQNINIQNVNKGNTPNTNNDNTSTNKPSVSSRETFSSEIDNLQFKVKFQSQSLLILTSGTNEYRLDKNIPIKIKNFQIAYSPSSNSVVCKNSDDIKIAFDIINEKLYLQN